MIWPLGIWTTAMLACLCAGVAIWRFKRAAVIVACLMAANYFGTAIIRDHTPADNGLMFVGFLDALAAFAIYRLRLGDRANIVAALFLFMLPIYAIGWLFQWDNYATFTLVEPFGWLQIAVVGNVDRGIGKILGRLGRRNHGQRSHRNVSHRPVGAVSARNVPKTDRISEADGRR